MILKSLYFFVNLFFLIISPPENDSFRMMFFYARKQLCFQRVSAIAILSVRPSVRPSVCHTGGSGKNGPS